MDYKYFSGFLVKGKYNSTFEGRQYAYYHEEDESSFQLVDTARVQRPIYQRGRRLFQQVGNIICKSCRKEYSVDLIN